MAGNTCLLFTDEHDNHRDIRMCRDLSVKTKITRSYIAIFIEAAHAGEQDRGLSMVTTEEPSGAAESSNPNVTSAQHRGTDVIASIHV